MKKIICVLLALLLAALSAGCRAVEKLSGSATSAKDTQEAAASVAPGDTDPAQADVTPAPGLNTPSAPDQTAGPGPELGIRDYCAKLEQDTDLVCDLDLDGLSDTVRLVSEEGEYELVFSVLVTLGSDPGNTLKASAEEEAYSVWAWIVDCDPYDGRLDILLQTAAYEWWDLLGVRVSADGKRLDTYPEFDFFLKVDDMEAFTSEGGLPIAAFTDILGTRELSSSALLTEGGFSRLTVDYTYDTYDDIDISLVLTRDMPSVLVDEFGTLTDAYTIPAGTRITPYSTDRESYAVVELPDGRHAFVEVEVRTWEDYGDDCGIFINGLLQDEYADIQYAG